MFVSLPDINTITLQDYSSLSVQSPLELNLGKDPRTKQLRSCLLRTMILFSGCYDFSTTTETCLQFAAVEFMNAAANTAIINEGIDCEASQNAIAFSLRKDEG